MELYYKCRIQLTCLIKQNLWCFNFTALPAPNSTNLAYCLYLDRACGRHGRRAVENYTTAPDSTETNITGTNNIIISHMKLDVNSISQQITPLTVDLMALSMRTWVGQFPLGSPPAHLPAKKQLGISWTDFYTTADWLPGCYGTSTTMSLGSIRLADNRVY